MRNLPKMLESSRTRPFAASGPSEGAAYGMEGSLAMQRELIPSLPTCEWACTPGLRSNWAYYPQEFPRHHEAKSGISRDSFQKEPAFHAHPSMGGKSELAKTKETEDVGLNDGHSLFQEVFFFCTVKNVGDVPGAGCIYVETVVDRDSGIAFAKVYSGRSAINAVDILASRVIPFFERQGIAIKEIHTRKTSEYCGLLPVHPFETFLATSHIRHLPMDEPTQPYNYLCEQFYQFLLKEFLRPAIRRTFQLTLDGMQKSLDTFVDAYNALQVRGEE